MDARDHDHAFDNNSHATGSARPTENDDQQHPAGPFPNDSSSHDNQASHAAKEETSSSRINQTRNKEIISPPVESDGANIVPTIRPPRLPNPGQRNINIKLIEAVRDGDLWATKKAIQNNADLSYQDEFSDETALHIACRLGKNLVVQELLRVLREHGMMTKNMETRDMDEWTPLHSACSRNQTGMKRIFDHLLKHDNPSKIPRLSSPAKKTETEEILKLLFQHGGKFDIDARTDEGMTALHLACKYTTGEPIRKLVKEGANVRAQDKQGNTPLMEACRVKSTDAVELLLAMELDAGIDLQNDQGSSPLTLACQFQAAGVVKRLLDAGADCNTADKDENTPLMKACRYGDEVMVKNVLQYMLKDLHQTNSSGESALDCTMLNKDSRNKIIPLLLNRGLELNQADASILFARPVSGKMSGGNLIESPWLGVVLTMLKEHEAPLDISLPKAMQPLLEFASREEKVAAIVQADTKTEFEVLVHAMKEPGLHKNVCQEIRRARPASNKADARITAQVGMEVLRDMLEQDEDPDWTKIPRNLLQLAAYYGDYLLVWYLLRTSRSVKKGTIESAKEIAKARKPTKLPQDNIDTEGSKSDAQVQSDRESTDYMEIDRYDRTIIALENVTAVESMSKSMSKKIPERPKAEDLHEKMTLLQEHQATIVDFYERRGEQIDILRSEPSVYDLVYVDGARLDDIMSKAKSNLHEMTSTTPDKSADMEKPQLRWIHLPANHMDWMEHLTERIYDEKHGKGNQHWKLFYDLAQRSRVELPTDQSTIRFMKPICLKEDIPQKESTGRISGIADPHLQSNPQRDIDHEVYRAKSAATNADAEDDPSDIGRQVSETAKQQMLKDRVERSEKEASAGIQRLALYTPYITLGYCHAPKRESPDTRYKQLSKSYVGSILHGPRSLDRFYYNALKDDKMDERDRSQVVTRRLLKEDAVPEGAVLRKIPKWPYITVDQLWVWVIDDETIITSSTIREDQLDHLLVDRVFDQLRNGSQDGSGQTPPSSATEMSRFLVSTCFGFIDNLAWKDVCEDHDWPIRKDSVSKPVLLLYQENLNEAMAKEKELFQEFRKRTTTEKDASVAEVEKKKEEQETRQTSRQYGTKASKTDDGDLESNSLQNLNHNAEDWDAINRAAKLLDEVKDIRDELVILRFLVARQEGVWNGLMSSTSDKHDARDPSFTANELDEMIKTTDTIQKSVNDLLTLEEDSIKIKESILSRDLVEKSAKQSFQLVELGRRTEEQTEKLVFLGDKADQQSAENARQEKILKLFTFVTVIFTPLSFLASFYAVNTTTSRHNDDGELEYEPEWMNQRIFGISAGIVGPLLIYGLFSEIQTTLVQVKDFIQFLRAIWILVKWRGRTAKCKSAVADMKEYLKSKCRKINDGKAREDQTMV